MKGCYKTKDILKRGTILCMAAMLSFGTVACGSNSSKSASSSEKSTESSASSSTEAGKRNQKLFQMTRLAVLQVQGLHQEQHQKVKWIKDDCKSVCFNRRTLLIFAGNLFRRGAGYEERTGIAY